jgi:hypothetical protein
MTRVGIGTRRGGAAAGRAAARDGAPAAGRDGAVAVRDGFAAFVARETDDVARFGDSATAVDLGLRFGVRDCVCRDAARTWLFGIGRSLTFGKRVRMAR